MVGNIMVIPTVDHIIEFSGFQKFHSDYKNIDEQANSERPKTVDSEAVDQIRSVALREYQANSVSPSSVWFITFITLAKTSKTAKLSLILPKYRKTFNSPWYYYTYTQVDAKKFLAKQREWTKI